MRSRYLTLWCWLALVNVTLAQQPFAQPPAGQPPRVPTQAPPGQPQLGQPQFGQPQAQPPAQAPVQPPLDPVKNPLDHTLLKWEQAMNGMRSLAASCVRTKVDKVFQSTEVFEGLARYLKSPSGSMASLDLKKKNRPEVFEKYIITGTALYEFAAKDKEVRVHEMPKPASGQVSDDGVLSLIFGMKAEQAKQRYDMVWIPPPAGDKWYQYLEIKPRWQQDKTEFARARLVLLNSTFLPRQLWFEDRNGSEITWDFPQMVPNVDLNPREFAQPDVPPGWRLTRVPQQNQPRVLRNQEP